jgi:hypothetical protein
MALAPRPDRHRRKSAKACCTGLEGDPNLGGCSVDEGPVDSFRGQLDVGSQVIEPSNYRGQMWSNLCTRFPCGLALSLF